MSVTLVTPREKLAEETISALRWVAILIHSLLIVSFVAIYVVNLAYSWGRWLDWLLIGFIILTILSATWFITLRPVFLYKNFRYDIGHDFLQLKSGALYESHHVVPMSKIQAVSTNQGPVLRRFDLYALEIDTMGSSHKIPTLSKEIAKDVRNQIAHFAKIKEEDE